MRYTDSGNRSPEEALGSWLGDNLTAEVHELRLQSGYFSADGLPPFKETLERLSMSNLPTRVVIGSNGGETRSRDVAILASLLGLPRSGALLGIVNYNGSLFHPKVYHLRRTDGSQAAYVGSANLSMPGIGSLNVETGLIVDTREGDDVEVLSSIAQGIDRWFTEHRPGITIVSQPNELADLERTGLLAANGRRRRQLQGDNHATQQGVARPRLEPLVRIPPFQTETEHVANATRPARPIIQTAAVPPSTNALIPTSTTESTSTETVLIAEIPKAGSRWKQANFNLETIRDFFQVDPGGPDTVSLFHVADDGSVGSQERRRSIAVKSQNYRFELDAAAGLGYPQDGRPIAIFLRIKYREFKYILLMPNVAAYSTVSTYLRQAYAGSARRVRRVIIDAETLKRIWQDCPFWT